MSKPPASTWYELTPLLVSDRRHVLQGAVVAAFWLASAGRTLAGDMRGTLIGYTRTFFTDVEWVFVLAACSRLIPSSAGAGGT